MGVAYSYPLYVLKKDVHSNTVVLGPESSLYSRELAVTECNLITVEELRAPMEVTCKVRYRMKAEPAVISPLPDGNIKVTFDQAQRAITPGQAAVFYDGSVVVGGGTIL